MLIPVIFSFSKTFNPFWSTPAALGRETREKYTPWASFDKVALKVWSSFFYCPLTYKYFSYHFLLYICVGIFWETNNKYFCYHFFIVFLCCYIVVVITKAKFREKVFVCFLSILLLPQARNMCKIFSLVP